ncbi:hypothetical protein ACLB1E_08860 [Escherichia coli]
MMLKLNSTLADSQPQNHVLCPVRLTTPDRLSKMGKHEHHCDFFSCFAGLLTTCGMADKSAIQTASAALDQRLRGCATRKLTPEERSAVENYLESLTQVLQVPGPTVASARHRSPGAECRKQRHDANTRYHALRTSRTIRINGVTTSIAYKSSCPPSGEHTSTMRIPLN